MTCPKCGTKNSDGALICEGCAHALNNNTTKGYSKDFAWVSMVLGIVSMLIFPYLYGPLAVVASLVALKLGYQGKMAVTGLILGCIALVAWIVMQFLL